jgi:hypothetical protein
MGNALTLPRKFEVVHRKTTNSNSISPRVCRATPPIATLFRVCPCPPGASTLTDVKDDLESWNSKSSEDSLRGASRASSELECGGEGLIALE